MSRHSHPNRLRRALTHPALVLGCTLLYGMRELLALQRLRWSGPGRRRRSARPS